jgi:hypothetical protein
MSGLVDPRLFSKDQPLYDKHDIEIAHECAKKLLYLIRCPSCNVGLDWDLTSLTAECPKCDACYYSTIGAGNPKVYRVNRYRAKAWKKIHSPK